MSEHPIFKVDESEFTKNFNLSALLAKIALGVISAIVIRTALDGIDKFIGKKKS